MAYSKEETKLYRQKISNLAWVVSVTWAGVKIKKRISQTFLSSVVGTDTWYGLFERQNKTLWAKNIKFCVDGPSCVGGGKNLKNEIVLFLFFSTSGASEHFQAPSCTYLESARRVLLDEHKLSQSGARKSSIR